MRCIKWLWHRRRPVNSTYEQFLQEAEHLMASISDIQTNLSGLKSDFDTLVAAAKAAYNAKTGVATQADLDAINDVVSADRTAVNSALATITGAA